MTFKNVGPAVPTTTAGAAQGGDVEVTLDFSWEPLLEELRARERDQIASYELLAERLGQIAEAVRGMQLTVTSPEIRFEPTIVVQPAAVGAPEVTIHPAPVPVQVNTSPGTSCVQADLRLPRWVVASGLGLLALQTLLVAWQLVPWTSF